VGGGYRTLGTAPPHVPALRIPSAAARRRLPWAIAAAATAVWVARAQVSDRAPLVWDEAARVNSGMQLAYDLRALDTADIWQWFTLQDYYPFLGPALHGLIYLGGGGILTAAWLPALLAYAAAGVVVGRLAAALGAGEAGAWMAAALFWLTPLEAKLAAGAFTETMGACLAAGVVLALVRLGQTGRRSFALGAGALAGTAWWLKYDYGLLATATIVGVGLVTALRGRAARIAVPYAWAAATAVALFAVSIGPGWSRKVEGLRTFTGSASPGQSSIDFLGHPLRALQHVDLAYYPSALFGGGGLHLSTASEVGITTLTATLLVGGVAWALFAVRRHPALLAPLVLVAGWMAIYSLAGVKFPRYVAPLIALLAALAGTAGGRAWAYASARGRPLLLRAAVAGAAVAVAVSLALQASHLDEQFAFLAPDPPAAEALGFITGHLPPPEGIRPIVMIGQTNELSLNSVRIAWNERLGRQAPAVEPVTEAPVRERSAMLLSTLYALRPIEVVGIDVRPGSALDTLDFRRRWPSQRDYFRIARRLEQSGALVRVAQLRPRAGRVGVTVWRLSPNLDARILASLS
jgi:hypothetical protein